MKKFTAFALALVAAAVSQAATVEWSSGDLGALAAQHADITGVTAYYYVISDEADYTRLSALNSDQLYAEYFNEDGTAKIAATETVTANAFGVANWEQEDASTPTAYVVAIYVAKSDFGGSYALASTAYAEFDNESAWGDPSGGNFDGGANDGIAGAAFVANGNSWAAVPEPTTVALLAIGVAAVGLKRKIA